MFKVKLNELYEVIDSCLLDPNNDFCPVLVEIKKDELIRKNGGKIYLL